MLVEQGQLLAKVDDRSATLKANQAKFQLTLAQQEAVNDIAVRLATKTHEVAVQELKRAQRINQKLPNSVSAVEVALKQLASDRTALELENAKYQQGQAEITAQIREAEFELAQHEVQQHGVYSPIDGMIVHVEKRAGEYVELGAAVARVVRVDRVRAEGFAPASLAAKGLLGRRATLHILLDGKSTEVEGKVVFVSPEADPVNQEVPIWAEFKNQEMLLKPGLRGRMIIHADIAAVAANQSASSQAKPSQPQAPQP
jgi:multidrug efflux pump subunit AcrA (membrane-fusion protein)